MKVVIGDLFQSDARTLINTVNCVGIMGKGIAAEFKKRFPSMMKDYMVRCKNNEVKPGEPYLYKDAMFDPQIINFPTKSHWRAASRIEDIEKGLRIISEKYKAWDLESIAIPPLGCGNGQLLWEAVGPLIYKYTSKWEIPVTLYAPYGTPQKQLTTDFLNTADIIQQSGTGSKISQKLNPAWVVLTEIIYRIEKQKYHLPVGRTIFQKIAYLATALGLPTGLNHVRGSYGPFCTDLNHVKSRLANAGLLQEKRLGQMFQVIPGVQYEKTREKYKSTIAQWDGIIDKIVDLFLRLDTGKAEVVATVLYVEKELQSKNKINSEKDILDEVMKWKQRRRPPINESEVSEIIRNLGVLKWFTVKPSPELLVDQF